MDKIRLTRLRIAGRVAGALMLLVGQSAMASELSYTFVELGYVGGTLDYFGSDADYDGFALSGSAEIGEMFFLSGSYEDGDTGTFTDNFGDRVSIGLQHLRLGVGLYGVINQDIDWVASVDFADVEVDLTDSALGSASGSDSGYIVEAGIRGVAGDAFEYSAAIIRLDIGESETGFRLGGRYHFGDFSNVSAGLDYVQYGSDWDQLELGIRYQFD